MARYPYFEQVSLWVKVLTVAVGFVLLIMVDFIHQVGKTQDRLERYRADAVKMSSTVYGVGEEKFYIAETGHVWVLDYAQLTKIFAGNGFQGLFIDITHKSPMIVSGFVTQYTAREMAVWRLLLLWQSKSARRPLIAISGTKQLILVITQRNLLWPKTDEPWRPKAAG